MDIEAIIEQLRDQRDRLGDTIFVLERLERLRSSDDTERTTVRRKAAAKGE